MLTLAKDTSNPPPTMEPAEDIDSLLVALVKGQEESWPDCIAILHPLAMRLCQMRLPRQGGEASVDLCRDVATKTLERMQRANYGALRRYLDTRSQYPNLKFESWFRVVVANVHTDHLRSLPEHQRLRDAGGRRHFQHKQVELSSEPAGRDDLRRHVEIRRVLAWLADTGFPDQQRNALLLWMRGHDADEIATEMKLPTSADATRLLRAGRQRLRRRFEERP